MDFEDHKPGECGRFPVDMATFNGVDICVDCAVKLINLCQDILIDTQKTLEEVLKKWKG